MFEITIVFFDIQLSISSQVLTQFTCDMNIQIVSASNFVSWVMNWMQVTFQDKNLD